MVHSIPILEKPSSMEGFAKERSVRTTISQLFHFIPSLEKVKF